MVLIPIYLELNDSRYICLPFVHHIKIALNVLPKGGNLYTHTGVINYKKLQTFFFLAVFVFILFVLCFLFLLPLVLIEHLFLNDSILSPLFTYYYYLLKHFNNYLGFIVYICKWFESISNNLSLHV